MPKMLANDEESSALDQAVALAKQMTARSWRQGKIKIIQLLVKINRA
jgi:hypothetical protein